MLLQKKKKKLEQFGKFKCLKLGTFNKYLLITFYSLITDLPVHIRYSLPSHVFYKGQHLMFVLHSQIGWNLWKFCTLAWFRNTDFSNRLWHRFLVFFSNHFLTSRGSAGLCILNSSDWKGKRCISNYIARDGVSKTKEVNYQPAPGTASASLCSCVSTSLSKTQS